LGVLYYLIYVISYIVELTLSICAWHDRVILYTGAVEDTGNAANTRNGEMG